MADQIELKEFLAGYLVEVEEHLSSAERNLLDVETALARKETRPRAVRELFRSLHTIKGLSAMVGIDPIVDLAHAMETVLRVADRAAGAIAPRAVDALAQGLRALEQRVRAVAEHKAVPPVATSLLDAFAAVQGDAAEAAPPVTLVSLPPDLDAKLTATERAQLAQGVAAGRRAVRVDFVPSPARAGEGVNITAVRERIGALGEIVKVVPVAVPRSEQAPGGLSFALLVLTGASDDEVRAAAAGSDVVPLGLETTAPLPALEDDDEPFARRTGSGVVRVEVSRLDDALDKLSALVVNRFRLTRAVADLAARGVDLRSLHEILVENGRQLRDLRGAIMRARMVPVSELLERVPLIVRGLSRSTGKKVRLEIDAGKAELDKGVAERIFPAIVHLVRNAVDHAVESPEERTRLGKPAEGVLRVSCHERGGAALVLSVTDDGRGVDRDRVAAKAGRPAPGTDTELLELLALPGLSTAAQATTTSGRGMGVDIVRRIVVDDLGGELSLVTAAGKGTTFTMRVPTTITIVDAFSFLAGAMTFVVPVATVEEIVEIDPVRVVATPGVRVFERRGEAVPLVDLESALTLAPAGKDGPRRKAIVVRRNGTPFAFGVDRMLGQQEIVVRPVDDPLVRVQGVTGSTDLGDGRPILVLDLVSLAQGIAA